MAETITSARVRIACHTDKYDQLLDQRTGKPVVFWGGNDIDFDIGVFFGNEPANLSNLTSISLEVKPLDGKKPPSPDTTPLMSKTVTDITATITQAGWDDYSEQHCVISFTDAESNLEAGNYWIVVSYLTNAGKIATIGAGVITIKQDGTGPVLPPDPIDPPYVTQDELENYYLKTQADARYLQIANNLSDLDDAADARANLGLAKLQPAPYSVVVHNGSVSNNRAGKLIMAYGDGVVGAVSPQSARSAIELDKDQAADDSIVTHDGTVTNANTDQITEVDSNGKVRASGKSFGASNGIDALGYSEDIAVTSRDIFNLLGTPVRVWKAPEIITAVGGGATLSTNNAALKTITLNGTGDTAWFGWSPQVSNPGWGPGSSGSIFLQFGKIFTLSALLALPTTATGTETRFGFYRGAPYQKTGPFTATGEMGVLIKGDLSVHLIWYDSTAGAEIEHDLGYTFPGSLREIRLMGYHRNSNTGRLQLWVDGEIVGSVTHNAYSTGVGWYAALTSSYTSGSDPRELSVWAMTFYQSPISFLTI